MAHLKRPGIEGERERQRVWMVVSNEELSWQSASDNRVVISLSPEPTNTHFCNEPRAALFF